MPQPYPHGELVIVIDCSDLDQSARFWSGVLGYTASTGPSSPGPASAGSYRRPAAGKRRRDRRAAAAGARGQAIGSKNHYRGR